MKSDFWRAGYVRLSFLAVWLWCLTFGGSLAAEEASPEAEQAASAKALDAYAETLVRLNRSIAENPDGNDRRYQERGVAKFMAGDFKGAVADFDRYLEANPDAVPHHWQRGMAQYAAGLYREGREQFEDHRKVNPHDVENAVWHFLCVAALEGEAAARSALIPIAGDTRVPMAEIHDLFAGKGSEEEVLEAAAGKEEGKRNHLCYAHLYLGLYHEALKRPDKALSHYEQAATTYAMPHYMGLSAQVLFKTRKAEAEKAVFP